MFVCPSRSAPRCKKPYRQFKKYFHVQQIGASTFLNDSCFFGANLLNDSMHQQTKKKLHLSASFTPLFFAMGGPLPLLSLLCCLTFLLQGAAPATFTITNSCEYTVCPGILSNAGAPQPSTTGFALPPGQTLAVTVASAWSGRIWGRTLCATDSSGAFACATADCGSGAVECSGRGAAPPATLAEITLAGGTGGDDDFYDVSLVDGFNVPMLIAPHAAAAANGSSCQATSCAADVNRACPAELCVTGAGGAVVACRSACEAFAEAQYCCSGAYGSPAACAPTKYSRFFKGQCPAAYSYAFDDATSTFTCAAAGGGYDVVFCPGTSKLQPGGNPEAAGLPPSSPTMQFSGGRASAAGGLVKSWIAAVVVALLVIVSATSM